MRAREKKEMAVYIESEEEEEEEWMLKDNWNLKSGT